MIEREHASDAERIEARDLASGRLAQHRQQVDQRQLEPVHLAGLQRCRCGGRVRLHEPFHPLEIHHLAAGEILGLLLPRHVVRVLHIDRLRAGLPFVSLEDVWPGADVLLDLLRRRRLRHPFRHHKAALRSERIGHLPEALLQPDLEALVVERLHLLGLRGKLLAEWVLDGPACDRCGAVDPSHRLAVGELQTVTQSERPGEFIRRQLVTRDHLWLADQRIVDAVQRIPHHVAMVGCHRCGGPDRVRVRQIGLGHEVQHLGRGTLGGGRSRQPRRTDCRQCGSARQQIPASHACPLMPPDLSEPSDRSSRRTSIPATPNR